MHYDGRKSYTLSVAGLTRDLPVVQVSPDLWIASFVMLGDTERNMRDWSDLLPGP